MEDLTGKTFEKWYVKERAYDRSKSKGAKWLCQCECGTEKIVWGKYLRSGKSKSCGCIHTKNWIGDTFNMLTVIDTTQNDAGDKVLVCKCDCGNIITIPPSQVNKQKSCGCGRKISRVGEKYGKLTIDEMHFNLKGDNVTYV